MESHENGAKTKNNLEKLKKNLFDVETLVESKNNNVVKCVKKSKIIMYAIQKTIECSNKDLFIKCQENFEYNYHLYFL